MAWFPHTGGDSVVDGDGVEVLFVREDIWVVSKFLFSSAFSSTFRTNLLFGFFRGLTNKILKR